MRCLVRRSVTTGWSIVDQVHDIDVPTLAINGRYEVAQDYVTEAYIMKDCGCKVGQVRSVKPYAVLGGGGEVYGGSGRVSGPMRKCAVAPRGLGQGI